MSIVGGPRSSTKIYIGNLPVTMNEGQLAHSFQQHCQVSQVISIKKGNAQGNFDKFCYGFVTITLPQNQTKDIMNKVSYQNPNWRLKIKQQVVDNQQQKFRPNNNFNQIPGQYPGMMNPNFQQQNNPQMSGMNGYQPMYQQNMNMRPVYVPRNNQQQPNDKGQLYGQKQNRIMVRQIWLGGIPEMIDENAMTKIMSQFGLVQNTQIFPKFAFVKFKRAQDASLAYQRAQMIFESFGQNSGFRIAFSDPSRRKQIVSNHFQFQRNASTLPVLFLGFPPVTSANVQINHLLSICQKYGKITNHFLKKSTNSQMRSYVLFTYDNIKNAVKAKQQLCRRKDLLGQKRVQITLLLQQQSVIKNKDFSHTEQYFVNDLNNGNKIGMMNPAKRIMPIVKPFPEYYPPPQTQPNQQIPSMYPPPNRNMYPMQPPFPGYQPFNTNAPNPGFFNPNGFFPPQNQYIHPHQISQNNNNNDDVFDLLDAVLDDPVQQKKKGPQKGANDKDQDTNDIISKMLGKTSQPQNSNDNTINQKQGSVNYQNDDNKDRQPDWSGFLTWRGTRRAGVDGYALTQIDFTDYSINISSILNNHDVILKDKQNIMVLQPTNAISQPIFNQYLKVLKEHTGVFVTKNWLIYLIGQNQLSKQITDIKPNDILVVMQRAHYAQQLKDKVKQCSDEYFQK